MECIKCLQNSDNDPDFSTDELGVCIYCRETEAEYEALPYLQNEFTSLIEQIKEDTKNDEYNCIVGMSGGVDSSYVAHLCGIHNLKPLIVHFDNGWNSELAVNNIKLIIEKYDFELHTLVVDWDEFADLQRSLIKSGVVDIEMASDHAIYATMIKLAKKYKIKYVLSGANVATESGMPPSWSWRKADWINMKNIHKIFGSKKLYSYPVYSSFAQFFDKLLGVGPQRIDILNYIKYGKEEAVNTLKEVYSWTEYEGKHFESFFTAFYQSYILPEKFGIDKRISHLSALIRNNELSKDDALKILNKPLYKDEKKKIADKHYFCDKLSFTVDEFDMIMKEKPVHHLYYKSDEVYFSYLKKITKILKKMGLLFIVKRYITKNKAWDS